MAYAQQHVISEGETPASSAYMNAEIQYIIAALNNLEAALAAVDTDLVNDTTPQLGGDLDAQNKNLLDVCTVSFNAEIDNGNSGTAKTIDLSAGMKQKITLTGNCTVTFSNPDIGHYLLKVIQDATGSRTLTLPSGKWVGGSAYTPTSDANAVDILSIYYDGSTYWYSVVGLDFS